MYIFFFTVIGNKYSSIQSLRWEYVIFLVIFRTINNVLSSYVMTYTYLKFAKKNTFQLDYSFLKKMKI